MSLEGTWMAATIDKPHIGPRPFGEFFAKGPRRFLRGDECGMEAVPSGGPKASGPNSILFKEPAVTPRLLRSPLGRIVPQN
jgi:hypothetical protein